MVPHSVSLTSAVGPARRGLPGAYASSPGGSRRRSLAITSATPPCAASSSTISCRCRSPTEAVGQRGEAPRGAGARGAPLVLENATFYAQMPGRRWTRRASSADPRGERLRAAPRCEQRLRERAEPRIDPRAFIDRIPLERVRELHSPGTRRPMTSSSTPTSAQSSTRFLGAGIDIRCRGRGASSRR